MTDAILSGKDYAVLVCRYILSNFEKRGIRLYREVTLGKSIIGKDRRIDILVVDENSDEALGIECKYQQSQGTADEKIPYSLDDLRAMRMPGCLVYAGGGFSEGILHMLRASDMAAYCLPDPAILERTNATWELDHILAMHFKWWDIIIDGRKPFEFAPAVKVGAE